MINDPDFSATVSVGQYLGLLKGTLSGNAKIFYIESKSMVDQNAIVKALVSESGLTLDVGEVKKISSDDNDLFLNITVEPFSKPRDFKNIFVVK